MNPNPSDPRQRFRGTVARKALVVLLVISTITVLLLGGGLVYFNYNLLKNLFANQLGVSAQVQLAQITDAVDHQNAALKGLRDFSTVPQILSGALQDPTAAATQQANEALGAEFHTYTALQGEALFDHILVVLPQGTVVLSTNPAWLGKTVDIKDESSRIVYHWAPLSLDKMALLTILPHLDEKGQTDSFLVGISTPGVLVTILQDISTLHPLARAYYLSEGSFIKADAAGALTEFQPSAGQNSLLLAQTGNGTPKTLEYTSFDNQPVISHLSQVDPLALGVVIELPKRAIYDTLLGATPYAALLLFLSIGILAFLLWMGVRSLTRPLLSLGETTRKFADGQWELRAPVQSNDEIGLLAYSFNQMAEQLGKLYQNLETRVEARTQQMRAAAEVARIVTSATSQEEILRRTVGLLAERFGYYEASVYLVDENGKYALLHASSLGSGENVQRLHQIEIGARSLISWSVVNNQPLIVNDVTQDSNYLLDEALPDTRSEAVIPIAMGKRVLGVLNVESKQTNAFSTDDETALQILANQIATTIQNAQLLEATQVNLQEAALLYQASRQITQAESPEAIFTVVYKALESTSYTSILLVAEERYLKAWVPADAEKTETAVSGEQLKIRLEEINNYVESSLPVLAENIADDDRRLPQAIFRILRQQGCSSAALLPIMQREQLNALIVLGGNETYTVSSAALQPFASLAELAATALQKLRALTSMSLTLQELSAINRLSQAIALNNEPSALYPLVHQTVSQIIGDINFLMAIYDPDSNMIRIPYLYNHEEVLSLDPFPLGEGMTSILIRTRQPLMLVHSTEERARALGAKVMGKSAKSWLGVPMLVGGEPIGAIVVQDLEREYRFDEDDQRLLSTISAQVAAALRNARLLERTHEHAEQERQLYEVTSKIRLATDMQSVLATTAQELAKVLGASRAEIEVEGMSSEESSA